MTQARGTDRSREPHSRYKTFCMVINCYFDKEQFHEIKVFAHTHKTTFSGAVRLLIEWGLAESAAGQRALGDRQAGGP